ncbi:unnamed protein product [Chondrus crispus]|uniref:Uncharacterized protein n=1 Tax=Chondrus crispus TaxID=2769 RepID=R7QSA0_CHOCR|nr:unnamed protein product [Chondrus crispus]CDF40613.1 unnamed protein product [Chondrus crispus]|eukprot:XP_005710907.1 unnamed protein product [Chondrus crispus]
MRAHENEPIHFAYFCRLFFIKFSAIHSPFLCIPLAIPPSTGKTLPSFEFPPPPPLRLPNRIKLFPHTPVCSSITTTPNFYTLQPQLDSA